MSRSVALEASWQSLLGDQFDQPYMQGLRQFLLAEKRAGKRIYPPGAQMFAAMDLVPVEQVRVVIIGQDPYHGPNQAMGLSFFRAQGSTAAAVIAQHVHRDPAGLGAAL